MNWSPAIKELLSLHEIFRRLGFLSSDLYLKPSNCMHYGCGAVHIQFVLQHGREAEPKFSVDIWEDCTDVIRDWNAAVLWWNDPKNLTEIAEVFKASAAWQNKAGLLLAMAKKGMITDFANVERA